jgi:DNA primase
MDAIAAHQFGRTNVVASMGTALTERQIRLLERLRAKILLAMDADAAGIEATLRALQEAGTVGAIHAGVEETHPAFMDDAEFSRKVDEWSRDALKRATVNFFVVPLSGKDPDEMIRAGDGAWEEAIAHAVPFTDHVFDVVASRKDLSQPGGRAELLQELLPVVRLITEPTHQSHYVQRLAARARVNEKIVWQELQRNRTRRSAPVATSAAAQKTYREPQEEFLLALLLRHDELRSQGLALSTELFLLSEHRALFAAWREAAGVDVLRETLHEDFRPTLERILARDLPFLEGGLAEKAFEDCVARIDLYRLRQAKQASAAALTEPEVQEDVSAALEEALHLKARHGDAVPQETANGDDRTLALASALVEDDEMGRRLHQSPQSAKQQDATQDEGDS